MTIISDMAAAQPDCAATTLLTGFIPDQAALHGILSRIGNLGLTILMVRRLE
jgi:hypothetical protein